MNQYKQQLINYISELYKVDAVDAKKQLTGYTTEEEHDDDLQYYVYNNELCVVLSEYLNCAIGKRFRNSDGVFGALGHDFVLYINEYGYCEYKAYDYSICENIEDFRQLTNNIFSMDTVYSNNIFDGRDDASTILQYLLKNVNLEDINYNINGYYICSAEELLFDCGDNVPEYVRRYVNIQAFIDDLEYDQYIDLGDGDSVLYYGD